MPAVAESVFPATVESASPSARGRFIGELGALWMRIWGSEVWLIEGKLMSRRNFDELVVIDKVENGNECL